MPKNNKKTCQTILGWKVLKTADIDLPKSQYIELLHVKTGARYIHLANDSVENVFAVALKTAPSDSTGVAHILEHTVLTGSKKYPVRDPFFSMLKRSLQTFMNAFTSSDWTAYPFASPNKKDFYNLMSIYLDAVFFPNLKKLNFMQEGWRYEFDGDKLKYEGVVYNEMKGSMSSADRHMEEAINSTLYSEAPYHYNTGGDPAQIPNLRHEELIAFHKKNYHPSNAYFYSYGNLPLEDNLKMINENVMDSFLAGEKTEVLKEKRWKEAKTSRHPYPVSSTLDVQNKFQAGVAWLMCSTADNLEVFSLELLEDILLGSPASPMRKELLNSGLGSDLCDSIGYESELLDTRFVIGLKDIKEENIPVMENLVNNCLATLVEKGIDPELIEAVLNSNETRKKNLVNQPHPLGLQVFLDIMAPWIHGGDVSETLGFDELMIAIRKKVSEASYFENLIKKYFIENTHRALIVLQPDEKMHARQDAYESFQLLENFKKLSDAQKEEIKINEAKLRRLQEEKEDFSCLPSLELSDIEKKIEKTEEDELSTKGVHCYSVSTNGLVHFIGFSDLSGLNNQLTPLLPFFSYLLPKMSTKKRSYEELAKKIDFLSGGVSFSPQGIKHFSDNSDTLEYFNAQVFCLARNYEETINLLVEMIEDFDFSDKERLKKLMEAYYSQIESSIVDQGHMYAASKALSPFSRANQLNDAWFGLRQISYAKERKIGLKKGEETFLFEQLNELGNYLKNNLFVSTAIIGEKNDLPNAKNIIDPLIREKSEKPGIFQKEKNLRIAFKTNTTVSFVAAACEAPDLRDDDAPALIVASKILGRSFLHNEIREKRGAYGAFARYDYNGGNLWFGSYRDPHIVSTLEIIAKAKKYMVAEPFTEKEVEEAIIAVSSDMDMPGTPSELAKKAYIRQTMGLEDNFRQNFKNKLLDVKSEDIARVCDKYLKDDWQEYSVAIISSDAKIKSANEKLGEDTLEINSI